MAAYCFMCDAPVAGAQCSRCGRKPVEVDDPRPSRPRTSSRLDEVPRWVWAGLVVMLVAVLILLLQTTVGVT